MTGVQRYLFSILEKLPQPIQTISPTRPLHGVSGHIWEQAILPKYLSSNQILWSPSNTGPLITTKQVVTIHDLTAIDHPEFLSQKFSHWYRFLLPRLARRAQHIITVSDFTKKRLIDAFNISSEKITAIYNGVDNRFYPQRPDVIESAIKELNIPSSKYFVALGSLEPRKNLHRLLKAWAQIVNMLDDDVWLVLAGAVGSQKVFNNDPQTKLPPRVHCTGHVADDLLPALYSGSIGTVYISVYEGFGLPPLEAMASGAATLTSNCTALPEVVGDAALTVDPYNVDNIASGLVTLDRNTELRETLRVQGIERAQQFTWERAAYKTWQVLNNMETKCASR